MTRLGSWISAAALLAASACSSDDASTPAICNMLVNDGPVLSVAGSTAAAPTPAGGTVADGTFVLSAATLFGLATVPSTMVRGVFQITGNTMQQVGNINGTETRYTSTFTTSGSSVTTTDTCPAPSSATYQFTATPTTLRIYQVTSVGTLESAYTKR